MSCMTMAHQWLNVSAVPFPQPHKLFRYPYMEHWILQSQTPSNRIESILTKFLSKNRNAIIFKQVNLSIANKNTSNVFNCNG